MNYKIIGIIILVICVGLVIFLKKPNSTGAPLISQTITPEITEQAILAQMTPENFIEHKSYLLGQWVSDTNPQYEIEFTETEKIDIDNNQEILREPYSFKSGPENSGFIIEILRKTEITSEIITYSIIENSPQALIMTLVGGDGTTLTFSKKQ